MCIRIIADFEIGLKIAFNIVKEYRHDKQL